MSFSLCKILHKLAPTQNVMRGLAVADISHCNEHIGEVYLMLKSSLKLSMLSCYCRSECTRGYFTHDIKNVFSFTTDAPLMAGIRCISITSSHLSSAH